MTHTIKHTPMPWKLWDELPDEFGFFKVTDQQDVTIADIPSHPCDPPEWGEGNAYLIVAAPELRDLSIRLWAFIENGPDSDNFFELRELFRNVIAKTEVQS